jgi:hypothetical protein
MPERDRLSKQEREGLAILLHQEIWETLPDDMTAKLKNRIFKLAEERGIPLFNPVFRGTCPMTASIGSG